MSISQDIIFIDLSVQRENIPKRTMMEYVSNIMKCVEQMYMVNMFIHTLACMHNPSWVKGRYEYTRGPCGEAFEQL